MQIRFHAPAENWSDNLSMHVCRPGSNNEGANMDDYSTVITVPVTMDSSGVCQVVEALLNRLDACLASSSMFLLYSKTFSASE